jgi:hypothetical protein
MTKTQKTAQTSAIERLSREIAAKREILRGELSAISAQQGDEASQASKLSEFFGFAAFGFGRSE